MKVEWKDIKGYEGYYQISNHGFVKTLRKDRMMKPGHNRYLHVSLSANNKYSSQRIHRLIAEHFLPNPENKPEVNHINGIKTDNRVSNLEWCTHAENMTHAGQNNLMSGFNDDLYTIDPIDAAWIVWYWRANGLSQMEKDSVKLLKEVA